MEARLKLRREPEVYRIPMPNRNLYEVAQVAFAKKETKTDSKAQDEKAA